MGDQPRDEKAIGAVVPRREQGPAPSQRPAAMRRFLQLHDERRLIKSQSGRPFAGQERAHGVDQPPARRDQLSGDVEQPGLRLDKRVRAARASTASGLRDCAARSRSRARHVDQYDVGGAAQSASSASSLGGLSRRVSIAPRLARLAAQLRKPRTIGIGREDFGAGAAAASASALPPAPAHRSRCHPRPTAPQASTISWLPSSWTSTNPSQRRDDRKCGCRTQGGYPTG